MPKTKIDVGMPPYRIGREDPTGHLEFMYDLIEELQIAYMNRESLYKHHERDRVAYGAFIERCRHLHKDLKDMKLSYEHCSTKQKERNEERIQTEAVRRTKLHIEKLRYLIDAHLRYECKDGSHI